MGVCLRVSRPTRTHTVTHRYIYIYIYAHVEEKEKKSSDFRFQSSDFRVQSSDFDFRFSDFSLCRTCTWPLCRALFRYCQTPGHYFLHFFFFSLHSPSPYGWTVTGEGGLYGVKWYGTQWGDAGRGFGSVESFRTELE